MSFNDNAIYLESQVVITDTTQASGTSGSLFVQGGASLQDTVVTGHVSINNIDITPNMNDFVYEQQFVCEPLQTIFADITDFKFSNALANSFKAHIGVNVSGPETAFAIWELQGVYRPGGWVITSGFTGDITGVNFSINNINNYGQMTYTNSNSSDYTVTLRYRATTTAPPGTSPTNTIGVIKQSNSILPNTVVYFNSDSTLAASDLTFSSNVYAIGGASKLKVNNTNTFTNYSNGGAITIMGDASVAKNMIIGQNVGIAKTSPSYNLDVSGDINFSGILYRNGSVYSGSSIWDTNGTDVFYTAGNIGFGTSSPTTTLDVSGTGRITTSLTTGAVYATNITGTNIVATSFSTSTLNSTTLTVSNSLFTNASATNISSGTLNLSTGLTSASIHVTNITANSFIGTNVSTAVLIASSGITTGNINFTGNLYQNESLYVSSQWTGTNGNTLYYGTSGSVNVGIGTTAPSYTLDVNGTGRITTSLTTGAVYATNITSTNEVATNISSGTLNLSSGLTSASIHVTNENVTTSTISTALITSNLLARGNSNTIGSVFTTGGNVGIGTTAPSYNLDVNGTLNAATSLTSGAVYATNMTGTNIVSTNMSAGTMSATTYTGANLSLSGNLYVAGSVVTVNVTTTNLIDTNITVSSGLITNLTASNLYAPSSTLGNIYFGVSYLFSGSFTAANNVAAPASVTNLLFSSSNYVSFSCRLAVAILATSNLYEYFTLEGIYTNTGWQLLTSSEGDVSGIVFSITSGGQIEYTSTNVSGWTSSTFRYITTTIRNI